MRFIGNDQMDFCGNENMNRWKRDSDGKQIYYVDSHGHIIDDRCQSQAKEVILMDNELQIAAEKEYPITSDMEMGMRTANYHNQKAWIRGWKLEKLFSYSN